MCELVQTRCILPSDDFNEDVIFNLTVSNLPQDARLCCVFNMVDGRKRRRREERIPIAWCNTTMFDCMGQLRMGTMKLGFWPLSDEGLDEEVNAIGTTVSNPSTDAIQLEVEFHKFSQTVIYPELERVRNHYSISQWLFCHFMLWGSCWSYLLRLWRKQMGSQSIQDCNEEDQLELAHGYSATLLVWSG